MGEHCLLDARKVGRYKTVRSRFAPCRPADSLSLTSSLLTFSIGLDFHWIRTAATLSHQNTAAALRDGMESLREGGERRRSWRRSERRCLRSPWRRSCGGRSVRPSFFLQLHHRHSSSSHGEQPTDWQGDFGTHPFQCFLLQTGKAVGQAEGQATLPL